VSYASFFVSQICLPFSSRVASQHGGCSTEDTVSNMADARQPACSQVPCLT